METAQGDVLSVQTTASAPAPLVEAKLAAPTLRPDRIELSAVKQALEEGVDCRLTMFVAPAGYGKTTAIRSWCATQDAAVAWVTLDSGDDDPNRLWTYIANAAERVVPGLAYPVVKRLEVPGRPVEQAVDELMTMLGRRRKSMILVLDDLHTVTDPDSLSTLDHAIRDLPGNVRIFIGSRDEPPLALARLRASQQLVEVRARDLAFTVAEAKSLLVEFGGLPLTEEQVAVLVKRTEGWPAMLILARIWLRSIVDPSGAVSRFGGEQRFVADYLSSEVLEALDPELTDFLQRIAVLRQFTPDLADAALGRAGSASMIESLEQRSLFVTRLEQSDWFRIHPLFSEFAELKLETSSPGEAAQIHLRAARRLAAQLPVEALEHADKAGDQSLVGEILAEHHVTLIRTGSGRTLLRWAKTLPDDVLAKFADVAVAAAIATLLTSGGTADRNHYLRLVERAIAENPGPNDGYAAAAALIARTLAVEGGAGPAKDTGRRAVELTQTEFDPLTDGALCAYARVLFFTGDLAEARLYAWAVLEHPDAKRRLPSQVHARATLALVALEEGHLSSARTHIDAARVIVGRIGNSRSWLGANVSAALGSLRLAENRLDEAMREFVGADRFFRDEVPNVHQVWLTILIATAQARRGRLEEASAAAVSARDALVEIPDPGVLTTYLEVAEREIEHRLARANAGDLINMPSDAELAVLRLLAEGLTVRESADRLFVSQNTVRTHRRLLYRKLGVHSREAAIGRAEALGLLDTHSPG